MEARVTSREEQNIVKWGVAVVQMTDPFQATTMQAYDNVTMQVYLFFTTTRNNCSDLLHSWSIVATQICAGIHCDANRHTLLLILRLLLEDLMGLLVHIYIWVVFKKHGVEISHGGRSQVRIVGQASIDSMVRIKDIELGIAREISRLWKEGPHLVMKRAMKPECIRPRTSKDSVIDFSSNRCECKCSVILANIVPEPFGKWITTIQELGESEWCLSKGWELDLALQTTHAKVWMSVGGGCQFFRHEVKSMAVRARDIHFTKSMMAFRVMVLLAAKRNWEWHLGISWTCWMTNILLLLTQTKNKNIVKSWIYSA